MSFDTKILQEKINKVKIAFESGQFADVLIGALNTGNGLMQQRIFTQNKDTLGNSFGKYTGKKGKTRTVKPSKNKRSKFLGDQPLTPYERKRVLAGRQILRKDLEFTGGLRRAIETSLENDKAAVIAFNNLDAARIAHGQEAQITNIRLGNKGTTKGIGIKIFRLNTFEKEQVVEQARELINQIMKQ